MPARLVSDPRSIWREALVGWAMVLVVQGNVLLAEPSPAKQPAGTEIYQDFRKQTPLLPSFAMAGPDLEAVTRPEVAGLRITRSGTEAEHYPVSVVSKFTLSGDFEVTGTYELLSASRPAAGYGVGVALIVTTDPERRKFAKVARLMMPTEGSVYKTEFWNNDPPKAYKAPSVPTTVKAGRLRLIREGSDLRCLVADGSGEEFRQLLQVPFGSDDLPNLEFAVTDSGTPGNAVDVRLIDLRVRSGKPMVIPAPAPDPTPAVAEKAVPKGSLLAVQIVGGVFTLALLGLATWLVLRRRGGGTPPDPASVAEVVAPSPTDPTLISFPCPGCGKTMKTPANLAGKKGKCKHCGRAVFVPTRETGD